MAVYRFVTSRRAISKVYRDFDIRDSNWELNSVEWIGDLIRQIGAHWFNMPRQANVTVSSFKAAIPEELIRLDEVWKVEENGIGHRLHHDSQDFQQEVVGIEEGARREAYRMEPGCLGLTFETGTLLLMYRANCVDDNGWPLIPDNQDFEEAFVWYFAFKMMMRGWTHPNPQIDFRTARAEYLRYITQARDTMTFPTVDQMDELTIHWTGISPRETDYSLYGMSATRNPAFPANTGGPTFGTEQYSSLTTPEYNLELQRELASGNETEEEVADSECVDTLTPLVPTLSQPGVVGIQFMYINPPVKVTQCGTDGVIFNVGYSTTKAFLAADVALAGFPVGAVVTSVANSNITISIPTFGPGPYSATVTVFGIVQAITIEDA
jgi:hypothetical protein